MLPYATSSSSSQDQGVGRAIRQVSRARCATIADVKPSRIVEVTWDPARQTWKILRFRDDKSEGNFFEIVLKILGSIKDGVEAETVRFCSSCRAGSRSVPAHRSSGPHQAIVAGARGSLEGSRTATAWWAAEPGERQAESDQWPFYRNQRRAGCNTSPLHSSTHPTTDHKPQTQALSSRIPCIALHCTPVHASSRYRSTS
jgi:hypothetical protein